MASQVFRRFLIWRWVYFALLTTWSILLAAASGELGPEAWLFTTAPGAVPAAAFVVLAYRRPRSAMRFALVYDLFVLAAFVILLIILPNYMGFVVLFPLGGFIIEGLVLLGLMLRGRRSSV